MNESVMSHEVASKLCEILGIDSSDAQKVVITLEHMQPVLVEITQNVRRDHDHIKPAVLRWSAGSTATYKEGK